MDDLPSPAALLALARDVLLSDLLRLLPPERRLEARLVANCMAIAEREVEAGPEPAAVISTELERFYHRESACRSRAEIGPDAAIDIARRFARDLRIGAFENSPAREAGARAIMWRLVIAKLRLANPRFLAANRFA